ncbi:MAG: DNRLRE domain-containing protein [Bryobacteraceae bacterium]|nr:DNRLRE domain-containing protein [Bryobacteraceae bacterium]
MKLSLFLGGALIAASVQLNAAQGILTDDATVQVQLPTNNFGNLPQLQVGSQSNAFLRFSLTALPPGTTDINVQKATVRLYLNRVLAPGDVEFNYVDLPWSEKIVTFANAPPKNGTYGQFAVDTANGFVNFDATRVVQIALKAGLSSFGVALTPKGGAEVFFDSKESTGTSQAAQLDIQLFGPTGPVGPMGPAGPQGPTGSTGSSSLVGSLSSFQVADHDLSAGVSNTFYLGCPTGYPTLVSGGCGFPFVERTPDAFLAFKYFYSGPSPSNPNSSWQCSMYNAALTAKTVRLYVNCAR